MALNIFELPQVAYNAYALTVTEYEEISKKWGLTQAGDISHHTAVYNYTSYRNEMDKILGEPNTSPPWATFPPIPGSEKRSPSFGFNEIAPSLGYMNQQDQLESIIAAMICVSAEEQHQQTSLIDFLKARRFLSTLSIHVFNEKCRFLGG